MSMITRCPACGTMFKVVADQLRISEGWVRCGHCAEVFDASSHLQGDMPPAAQETPAPTDVHPDEPGAPLAAAAEVATEPAAIVAPPEEAAESDDFPSSLSVEAGEAASLDAPDSLQIEAEAQMLRETPLDAPFELRRQDDGGMLAPAAAPESPRPEPARVLEREVELHDLSFVQNARRQAFWSTRGMRALMVALLLVLSLLLLIQIGVHDRDRLAASEPALRPLLSRLCEPLGCRISPPRQIDMLVIESSSFNKLRGDAFRLNFSVKNQAAVAVALPSLELTLTDAQEQTVARRVLSPEDIGATASVIFPAADWSGSVTLAANGAGARIAGYRLLAFYP